MSKLEFKYQGDGELGTDVYSASVNLPHDDCPGESSEMIFDVYTESHGRCTLRIYLRANNRTTVLMSSTIQNKEDIATLLYGAAIKKTTVVFEPIEQKATNKC